VIQTGSTNQPEVRVRLEDAGRFQTRAEQRFLQQVEKAGPLRALPVVHCMKSASFGTSLFIEVDGDRSPDLSCPGQTNRQVAALQAEAQGVLRSQKAKQSREPKR
jgi:hypothetical protein